MLIACQKSRQSGFTLIEALVVVTIIAILTSVAFPSFQTWLINSQIRNAAESVSNGLQRARAEAVARNTNIAFTLVPPGSSWSVYYAGVPASGIDSRSSNEGSTAVTVTALAADLVTAATTVTYNSFGGVAANTPASQALAQVNFAATGGTRTLRVTIGLGGNPRMCDPNAPSTSPTACQ